MLKRIIGFFLIIILSIFIFSCSRGSETAHGYIEGRYTYLSTSVSGALKEIVQRGARVKKGQLLFTLDEQPESYVYDVAKQNYEEAIDVRDAINANLAYAKVTFERNKILVQKRVTQQSVLDNAKANYDNYVAQLAQANTNIIETKAQWSQANWKLGQKKIYAPVDGIVFDTYYRLGEYTLADEAILSLLAPQDIKAIFYIPESDLSGIKLQDTVSVSCDHCSKAYQGKISFIAPNAEYTPPVIYSDQTRNKLIYRIEAEFSPQDAMHLHPGQPITVTYQHNNV